MAQVHAKYVPRIILSLTTLHPPDIEELNIAHDHLLNESQPSLHRSIQNDIIRLQNSVDTRINGLRQVLQRALALVPAQDLPQSTRLREVNHAFLEQLERYRQVEAVWQERNRKRVEYLTRLAGGEAVASVSGATAGSPAMDGDRALPALLPGQSSSAVVLYPQLLNGTPEPPYARIATDVEERAQVVHQTAVKITQLQALMADMAVITARADQPLTAIAQNVQGTLAPLEQAVRDLDCALESARRHRRVNWVVISVLAVLVAVGTGIIIWLAVR